jgi:predicted small lipoprotein YifL
MKFGATILAAVITLALSACGQKGPLTLPPPPAAQESKAPGKPVNRPFPDVPATSEEK